MNNKEAVNEVLSAIREVCDLKRLEFGCEVKGIGKDKYFTVQYISSNDSVDTYCVEDDTTYNLYHEEYKIIGLPVHLEHLLWAVEKSTSREFIYSVDAIHEWKGYDDRFQECCKYNLQKSVEQNLNDNLDLTKWLHEVLVNKK